MQGFESAFKGTGVSGYPGGPFNPLGLGNSSKESMDDFKWREIRNGRLAMVAFLGFLAQHAATGKGPLDNLADHLAGEPVVKTRRVMGCDADTSTCGVHPYSPCRCLASQFSLFSFLAADPWAVNVCTNGVSVPINIF